MQFLNEVYSRIDDFSGKLVVGLKAVIDRIIVMPITRQQLFESIGPDVIHQVYGVPIGSLPIKTSKLTGMSGARIGGGAIPCHLEAKTIGAKNISSLVFASEETIEFAKKIAKENGMELDLYSIVIPHYDNIILELLDDNILFRGTTLSGVTDAQIEEYVHRIKLLDLQTKDWITICNLDLPVLNGILELRKNIFLDLGYDEDKRRKGLFGQLCQRICDLNYDAEIIFSANSNELKNLAKEFGFNPEENEIALAQKVISETFSRTKLNTWLVIHGSTVSFAVHPNEEIYRQEPWLVPTMDINPKRYTGAGDAFWSGFSVAYSSCRCIRSSVLFGNLVAAGRLMTDFEKDEYPDREKLFQLLRGQRLRAVNYGNGVKVYKPSDLTHLLRSPKPQAVRLH